MVQILEILDMQQIGGQLAISRYHYLNADGGADVPTAINEFVEFVVPATAAFQTTQVQHTAIRYRLVQPTASLMQEQAITPAIVGSNGSPAGPPNASLSVKYGLGATVNLPGGGPPHIKKGGKHFPGVDLAHMDPEALMDAGYNTLMATWFLAAKELTSLPWVLVVVSFETSRSHTVNTPTTRTTTKAIVQPTAAKYCPVISASVPSVSTQNTRKILRGRVY